MFLVGMFLVGTYLVGMYLVGMYLVGTYLVGMYVVGMYLVGINLVGMLITQVLAKPVSSLCLMFNANQRIKGKSFEINFVKILPKRPKSKRKALLGESDSELVSSKWIPCLDSTHWTQV